ncbi:MAG: EcsC family protein [Anaerolineae bacterium]|nr:EcsC family protein [Anaerolineae bacterium]
MIDANPMTILLAGFGLLCVLPLLVFGVLGFIIYRAGVKQIHEFVNPDVQKLHARFEGLQASEPNASRERLLQQMINREALKCAVIGALTGVGGFYTLPIALPVDIILSLRIQAALVNFIAESYDVPEGEREATIRTSLVMAGSGRVTESTTRVVTRFLVRVAGESFSKVVPILGAVISFVVNYTIVQFLGQATLRWYAEREPNAAALPNIDERQLPSEG